MLKGKTILGHTAVGPEIIQTETSGMQSEVAITWLRTEMGEV